MIGNCFWGVGVGWRAGPENIADFGWGGDTDAGAPGERRHALEKAPLKPLVLPKNI
jgi:hypothetical protein